MPDINPSLPVVGQPDSTEEPKVVTALSQLIAAVNDVDSAQILDATIGTADLANNAVTAAKIEAQQAWQTIALGGGPTYSPTTLAYFKDSLGMVHLRGDVITTSVAGASAGATLCTLPAGYRPVTSQRFTFIHLNGTTYLGSAITISTAGVVTLEKATVAGDVISFGNVHFRGEN
jgi:hypothetical protein